MEKRVLDYERRVPRRRRPRSGADYLWRGRRVVGLVVLLAIGALPAYAVISVFVNSYVAIGLFVLAGAVAPVGWYMHGRRRVLALAGIGVAILTGLVVMHIAALTTIRIQNDSAYPVTHLTVRNHELLGLSVEHVPPRSDVTFHFRSLRFRGPMTAFGTLEDGTLLSSSFTDLERFIAGGSNVGPNAARFFRTYVHVRITEAGEVEVRTRAERE